MTKKKTNAENKSTTRFVNNLDVHWGIQLTFPLALPLTRHWYLDVLSFAVSSRISTTSTRVTAAAAAAATSSKRQPIIRRLFPSDQQRRQRRRRGSHVAGVRGRRARARALVLYTACYCFRSN